MSAILSFFCYVNFPNFSFRCGRNDKQQKQRREPFSIPGAVCLQRPRGQPRLLPGGRGAGGAGGGTGRRRGRRQRPGGGPGPQGAQIRLGGHIQGGGEFWRHIEKWQFSFSCRLSFVFLCCVSFDAKVLEKYSVSRSLYLFLHQMYFWKLPSEFTGNMLVSRKYIFFQIKKSKIYLKSGLVRRPPLLHPSQRPPHREGGRGEAAWVLSGHARGKNPIWSHLR